MKRSVNCTHGKIQCGLCGENYTDCNDKGGILFNRTFICPHCLASFEAKIKIYKEENYIQAKAFAGETFVDFVKRVRFYSYYTLN